MCTFPKSYLKENTPLTSLHIFCCFKNSCCQRIEKYLPPVVSDVRFADLVVVTNKTSPSSQSQQTSVDFGICKTWSPVLMLNYIWPYYHLFHLFFFFLEGIKTDKKWNERTCTVAAWWLIYLCHGTLKDLTEKVCFMKNKPGQCNNNCTDDARRASWIGSQHFRTFVRT